MILVLLLYVSFVLHVLLVYPFDHHLHMFYHSLVYTNNIGGTSSWVLCTWVNIPTNNKIVHCFKHFLGMVILLYGYTTELIVMLCVLLKHKHCHEV